MKITPIGSAVIMHLISELRCGSLSQGPLLRLENMLRFEFSGQHNCTDDWDELRQNLHKHLAAARERIKNSAQQQLSHDKLAAGFASLQCALVLCEPGPLPVRCARFLREIGQTNLLFSHQHPDAADKATAALLEQARTCGAGRTHSLAEETGLGNRSGRTMGKVNV